MGQLLRRLVDEEKIRSLAIHIAAETRESFVVAEESTGQQYRFVLPGPQLTEIESTACFEALVSLEQRPRFVVVSGSLPPGIPEDFYGRVARLAKEWKARLVLDTSGPALKAALAEGVYLVKPSLRELNSLMDTPAEGEEAWLDACRGIVARGSAQIVALTLGDRGALLVARDCAWRAPGLPIKAVSAVGAGDSFLGAMIWSLTSNENMERAFRYGIAAGTAALITPGTELCLREDVERLVRQVTVKKIWTGHSAP